MPIIRISLTIHIRHNSFENVKMRLNCIKKEEKEKREWEKERNNERNNNKFTYAI